MIRTRLLGIPMFSYVVRGSLLFLIVLTALFAQSVFQEVNRLRDPFELRIDLQGTPESTQGSARLHELHAALSHARERTEVAWVELNRALAVGGGFEVV